MDITQRKRAPGGGSKPRMIAVGRTVVLRGQGKDGKVIRLTVIQHEGTTARAVDEFNKVWDIRVETPAQ